LEVNTVLTNISLCYNPMGAEVVRAFNDVELFCDLPYDKL